MLFKGVVSLISACLFVLLLGVQSASADVEFICPCGVESVSQTGVNLTTGIRNLAGVTSGRIAIDVYAFPDGDYEGQAFLAAAFELDPLAAGFEYALGTELTAGLRTLSGGSGLYGIKLYLFERDESDQWQWMEAVRIQDLVDLRREGGWSDGSIVIPEEPDIQVNGTDLTIDVPWIINTGFEASDTLGIEVIAANSPDVFGSGFFFLLDESLNQTLSPGNGIANLSRTVNFAGLQAGFDYIHLIVKDSSDNILAWHTVHTLNGASITPHSFNSPSVDALTDADGDGFTDLAEAASGTDANNANDQPDDSVIRVLFMHSQAADDLYLGDIDARIAHLIAYSNQVLEDSGINAVIESAGTVLVDPAPVGDNGAVLSSMSNRTAPFGNLDAQRDQHLADLVTFFQPYQGDGICGIAPLGGYAELGDLLGGSSNLSASNSVVNPDCGDDTLIHEIGHNMGLGHSRLQGSRGTFRWSVGFGNSPMDGNPLNLEGFSTVMAYPSAFNTFFTMDNFSNPALSCGSAALPCGVSHLDYQSGADASLSMNVVAHQVASYRASPDTDGDGIDDDVDNCPSDQNASQDDIDGDGLGDICDPQNDTDSDGDLIRDEIDNCVFAFNPDQLNSDGDPRGNECDLDDDNDRIPDAIELINELDPLDPADALLDLDGDGVDNLTEFLNATDMDDPADSVPPVTRYLIGDLNNDGYEDRLVINDRNGTLKIEWGGLISKPLTIF